MIAALPSQHGSVGKTTLASQFASRSTREEKWIAVIDADPQGPTLDLVRALRGCHLNSLPGVIGLSRNTPHREPPSPSYYSDYIVTDGSSALCRPTKIVAFQRGVGDLDMPRDLPARQFPTSMESALESQS